MFQDPDVTSADIDATAVPEPGTLLLVGSGIVAAVYRSRRARRSLLK